MRKKKNKKPTELQRFFNVYVGDKVRIIKKDEYYLNQIGTILEVNGIDYFEDHYELWCCLPENDVEIAERLYSDDRGIVWEKV